MIEAQQYTHREVVGIVPMAEIGVGDINDKPWMRLDENVSTVYVVTTL